RASIGISEVSDAITVVISEETGNISVSFDGKLTRDFSPQTLKQYLIDKLMPEKDNQPNSKKRKIWRKKNEKN
ncbi:MAG: diadenylate cyclase, partial [Oscillospiraceae bacterium]